MPRFFFHVNGETDTVGFKMTGWMAAKRHADGLETASRIDGDGALPWKLTVTNENSATVISLPRITTTPP